MAHIAEDEPIPTSNGRLRVAGAFFVASRRSHGRGGYGIARGIRCRVSRWWRCGGSDGRGPSRQRTDARRRRARAGRRRVSVLGMRALQDAASFSETLAEAGRARILAASRVEWTVDFPKVSTRVLWMARNLDDTRPAAAMKATGARLFRGEGKLTDPRTVAVDGEQLTARRAVVIANGSTAAVPRIPGLDTVEYLDQSAGGDSEGVAGVARDSRRRRHRRRVGASLRTPRLQSDPDRSWTHVLWSRGARGRSRAPAASGGGRHDAGDRGPLYRRRKAR